ncbi:MAG: tetraacyldisaccharide 4'-kinase [Silanimonas sp.]|nr:MAG: tetraacyldisaccharide 4'-kinase [Silanimonas sp.]
MPRTALERWLLARWYGGVPPGLLLRGLAHVWGAVMRLRRWAYRQGWRRQRRLPVPVLVVGNRTVGGAGKTPLVIALIEVLRERGWRPGVVSRGYGRAGRGQHAVAPDGDARQVGDEPLLIRREAGCPVVVDRDRVAGAEALVALGCDLVIADDGLQHLRLGRNLEIEVEDARGLGNGRVLPAGPLREPLPARPAAFRVVQGREPRAGEWPMQLAPAALRGLGRRAGETRALAAFAGQRVHAVAGIGHPPRFFATLREAGLAVEPHPFPDHHVYVEADFRGLDDAPVLVTSKDAVKLRDIDLADAWELPVRAVLPPDLPDALDSLLRQGLPHVDP